MNRLSHFVAAVLVSLSTCAVAQFPDRPITIIVPYAGGAGAGDRLARLMAPKLAERLGGAVVVDNKVGADGGIGVIAVSNAKPDGYMLLQGDSGPLAISPAMKKVPYDPTSLVPIGAIASFPQVLGVNASLGAKTMPDLIKMSKTRPGGLDFAAASAMAKIGIELLKKPTDLKVTIVPFNGSAPAMQSAVAGQTPLLLANPLGMKGFFDAGQLIPVAVAGPSRISMLPNTPTFDELGIPGVHIETSIGLYAPRGTPREVIQRLNQALAQVMEDPALIKEITSLGGTLISERSSEALAARMTKERVQWQRIANEAGLVEK